MKALDAAKILINLSLDDQKPITNLKLQKMLYIAQAESDSKLIKEDFQAWDYRPVIPDVYRNFCINGSTPITKREKIPNNIDREKEKELAKIYNQSIRTQMLGIWLEQPIKKKVHGLSIM
ncbi:Panacea domain-containing protein [Helicobacter pylori]|uniref:Panacea domain-containing protein n=1 Tax=Helicobacter pylori TaxID=210 RepID=UPI002159EF89|nr:type II toxin-antitoxin system antitoxin SocA domain-containing protein [Helicobacter pylori]